MLCKDDGIELAGLCQCLHDLTFGGRSTVVFDSRLGKQDRMEEKKKTEYDLRKDADIIMRRAIQDVQPDQAVKKALEEVELPRGKVIVVALGKAAWQMAKAAKDILKERISAGVVITKYGHAKGSIEPFRIFEAGHPVPDENSFLATEYAADLVRDLTKQDVVIMLISGGGSSLFEIPLCTETELKDMTGQLLACGADITEMNIIRKRLSAVKGGKFALLCYPAQVFSVVLSDILGDPLDMIASGPAYPDSSTVEMCREVVEKYGLVLTENVKGLLEKETPKACENVTTVITGSVKELCDSAMRTCRELGYEPFVLTSCLNCVAREAGTFLGAIAKQYQDSKKSLAFLAGGETVVQLTGSGLGGRNQELALSAAEAIRGMENVAIFSFGSDGTDGPTDAAGGFVDGDTFDRLKEAGCRISSVLAQNDSYHALEKCGGLIKTGPTGTNVNDLSCILIR